MEVVANERNIELAELERRTGPVAETVPDERAVRRRLSSKGSKGSSSSLSCSVRQWCRFLLVCISSGPISTVYTTLELITTVKHDD